MKQCIYTFNGTPYNLVELLAEIDKIETSTLLDMDDIVFAKNLRQEEIGRQLETLRSKVAHEIKLSSRTDSLLAEDELGSTGGMSAQEFIDDPRCFVDGEALVRHYDKDELRAIEIANAKKKGNLSQEEAEKQIDQLIANRQRVLEDSVVVHKIIDNINAIYPKRTADFEAEVTGSVSGTNFAGRTDLIKSLKSQMELFATKHIYGQLSNPQIVSHLGIKGRIESLDQDIFGHIDYLAIDSSGVLHVYNFKASTQPMHMWSDEKKEKYKYYMAFIKQILKQNGIPVEGMNMHIVPITLQYNEDYSYLNDIIIGPTPVNISTGRNGYNMESYDNKAKFFIKSDMEVPNLSSQDFELVEEQAQYIVPGINIKSEGIHRSAIEYIRKAPVSGQAEPLVIFRNSDGTWEVVINGTQYHVKSAKPKNSNQEILDLVKEHISELEDNTLHLVNILKQTIKKIKDSGDKGHFVDAGQLIARTQGLSGHGAFLEEVLSPYLHDYSESPDGKKRTYNWQILDDLIDYNVLIIKNNVTNQIDFITLSGYNTDSALPLKKGTHTILGMYKRDADAPNMLPGTYGSLEILRTALLANQILDKLDLNNNQLGNIKVISPLGTQVQYAVSDIVRNYLPTIIQTVTDRNADFNFTNNFSKLNKSNFTDPIDIVIREYQMVTAKFSTADLQEYGGGNFQKVMEVANSLDRAEKIKALGNLLKAFEQGQLGRLMASLKGPQDIIDKANSGRNGEREKACRLYIAVSNAYHYYKGDKILYGEKLGIGSRHMSTSTNVSDANIRLVTSGLVQTFNTMATEIEQYYSKNLRSFIMDYLKAKGYSLTQNAIIGNINSVFEPLFELDDQGKKTMNFKNPYDDPDLKEEERVFLKKLLFELYQIRHGLTNPRGYSGYDDARIAADLKKKDFRDYLYVPLKRASSGTRTQQNLQKETWNGRLKRVIEIVKDPERWYDEFVEGVSEYEREAMMEGREQLSVRNPFDIGDGRYNNITRQQYIDKQGIDYFETNLEGLLIDYLTASIRTEKLNNFLVGTKALLLQMQIMGQESGHSKHFDEAIKYIQDFLTVNVYDSTIKNKFGQVITGALSKARSQVTLINLGGNLVSFFRDTFQGFEENYMRSLTKLNTDLDAKNISAAYAYVVTHGMTNSMNINMLSKLMSRYRLSNIDLASTESLKVGRAGVMNYRNWAYSTLRRPDFLNRMTLFVARCMQDGAWDGYSIEDDQLVYDWKKDLRFKALVDGRSKDDSEYKKALSLYMSMAREWNAEHPEDAISIVPQEGEQGLISPYSDKEIENIKALANNIYGAYDKALKGMAEHETIMWFFGMYTTWMNGIYNNYFGQNTVLVDKQARDEAGNLLFWDYDGNMVTEDTGMPVLEKVPEIVQGIWYTVKEIWDIGTTDGWKVAKDWILASPRQKANLSKLLSDILMSAFFFALFKLALDPAYSDFKKEMKSNPIFANLSTEIFYKALKKSPDSLNGPWNYVSWAFENNSAPIYDTNTKLIRDTIGFAFGDKTLVSVVVNNFAVARGAKDTYRAWQQAQK